jgi:hypothetical protein
VEYIYSMIPFKTSDIIFILKRKEENKIVERQRKKVCERRSMVEGGGSVGCKTDRSVKRIGRDKSSIR